MAASRYPWSAYRPDAATRWTPTLRPRGCPRAKDVIPRWPGAGAGSARVASSRWAVNGPRGGRSAAGATEVDPAGTPPTTPCRRTARGSSRRGTASPFGMLRVPRPPRHPLNVRSGRASSVVRLEFGSVGVDRQDPVRWLPATRDRSGELSAARRSHLNAGTEAAARTARRLGPELDDPCLIQETNNSVV